MQVQYIILANEHHMYLDAHEFGRRSSRRLQKVGIQDEKVSGAQDV
jgi:hypothetical protein